MQSHAVASLATATLCRLRPSLCVAHVGVRATHTRPIDDDASIVALHTNPFIYKYRKRPSKDFPKQTTGLTGLFVIEHPHRELSTFYQRILRVCDQMPADCVYRQTTEALVRERLALVESTVDIAQLEEKIGMGQIEEVLWQARYELECARQMLKHRVWDTLVEPAPVEQWRWPI